MKLIKTAVAALLAFGLAAAALAQEPAIRKNLAERLKLSAIDEVTEAPVPGLFEVRVGTDLFYTDAEGNFLLQGQIIDTKRKVNITQERQQKLLAVDFATLPLKDAFTVVRGNGSRKLAIFADPNCGYCKRFESDLQKVDNVTFYMFLYPILGPDSTEKSRNLWCSKDPAKGWLDWMLREKPPASATCDTAALTRNVEFGRKHKITGTPTTLFPDGTRVPGAITAQQVEKLLAGITQ